MSAMRVPHLDPDDYFTARDEDDREYDDYGEDEDGDEEVELDTELEEDEDEWDEESEDYQDGSGISRRRRPEEWE
jgi:hypothetical protein